MPIWLYNIINKWCLSHAELTTNFTDVDMLPVTMTSVKHTTTETDKDGNKETRQHGGL